MHTNAQRTREVQRIIARLDLAARRVREAQVIAVASGPGELLDYAIVAALSALDEAEKANNQFTYGETGYE